MVEFINAYWLPNLNNSDNCKHEMLYLTCTKGVYKLLTTSKNGGSCILDIVANSRKLDEVYSLWATLFTVHCKYFNNNFYDIKSGKFLG